jgi:predicted dehydrogenase
MGELTVARRLRLGMVGGGRPAGIGELHRLGARLDGRFELAAGCFSRDPGRNREAARRLGVDPARCYASPVEMAEAEAERADRADLVAVVTPNDTHVPIAQAFVERGFNVLCEKPLATALGPARALKAAVARTGAVFAIGHYFAGFPMLRQARAMAAAGALGPVRVVQYEHASEGLALGRPDGRPPVGAVADLGVHGAFVVRFVTGAGIERLAADAAQFTPGRGVEDDAHVLLRLSGGARGTIWASHAAAGLRRSIGLRVVGAKGALEWRIGEPDVLRHTPVGEPARVLQRGMEGLDETARAASRLPSGHAEGTVEAFAALYRDLADAIEKRTGTTPLYPTIDDGVAGVAFVEACADSAARGGAWVDVAKA